MRRVRYVETTTRAGRWGLALAWFGLFVALGGVIVARRGAVDPQAVLAVIGAGWLISALALVCAITGLVSVWRNGDRGGGRSFAGLVLALATLGWPAAIALQISQAPGLHVLSTDWSDPPQCSASSGVATSVIWAPWRERLASQQHLQQASQLQALPLFIDMPPAKAVAAVEAAVRSLGWSMGAVTASAGGGARFAATAHSKIVRFPQALCIRVRPTADGAQLDVQVASTYGELNPRAGLQRILDLHEAVQESEP